MTNIIEIIGKKELIERENLSQIKNPSFYVLKYLQEKITANSSFSLKTEHQDDEVCGYGMSYSNELKVVRNSNEEEILFTTGMLRWRAGHRDSLDRPEHRILKPSIITAEGNCLIFGYRTGNGDIIIYKLDIKEKISEQIESFPMRKYLSSLNRERLIKELLEDDDSFDEYVKEFAKKTFGRGWTTRDWIKLDEETAIRFMFHYDSDSDAAVDKYKFFVWKKGLGVGFSEVYHTNLSNSRRDYVLDIGVAGEIEVDGKITVEAYNKRHDFYQKQSFKIKRKECK